MGHFDREDKSDGDIRGPPRFKSECLRGGSRKTKNDQSIPAFAKELSRLGDRVGRLCERIKIKPDSAALGVACGTGAITLDTLMRAGSAGRVVRLHRNPDILDVARRHVPAIDWIEGRAEAPPFAGSSFDVSLCQFGLIFFDDRRQALEEMRRVVRSGYRIAVSV